MLSFIFVARNQSGERISGVEDADTADDLITRLQSRGLFVTSIKIKSEASVTGRPLSKKTIHRFTHSGIKEYDLILFIRQLATSIGSGVSLLRSLDAISRQIESRKLYDIVTHVMHDVESGYSLRDALAKHPKVFSNLWTNLVETGEASGNLPMVLDRLARYLEIRAAFKRKIISALIYPIILFSVATLAIIFFVTFIIPRFAEIFSSLNTELPWATQKLIALSDFCRHRYAFISVALVIIIIAVQMFVRSRSGKIMFDRAVFKVPLLNEYLRLSEIEKFTSTMSILLESGVPILYALEISEKSSDNTMVQGIIRELKDEVRSGKSLGIEMERGEFFPPMVIQMISIGEEIGELDKMFGRISVFFAELMELKITRFTIMFEPAMIILMGVIIGTMVISMFMPIFKIATLGT